MSKRLSRSSRSAFVGSLAETAARAAVTASVTFAAGWILKKMFEKSVATATDQANSANVKPQASKTPGGPPRYKAPAKRLPTSD
jgi:hypothetical protein